MERYLDHELLWSWNNGQISGSWAHNYDMSLKERTTTRIIILWAHTSLKEWTNTWIMSSYNNMSLKVMTNAGIIWAGMIVKERTDIGNVWAHTWAWKNWLIPGQWLWVRKCEPERMTKIRILVQVTIYRGLRIGRDGHLDQSEAYDIS